MPCADKRCGRIVELEHLLLSLATPPDDGVGLRRGTTPTPTAPYPEMGQKEAP